MVSEDGALAAGAVGPRQAAWSPAGRAQGGEPDRPPDSSTLLRAAHNVKREESCVSGTFHLMFLDGGGPQAAEAAEAKPRWGGWRGTPRPPPHTPHCTGHRDPIASGLPCPTVSFPRTGPWPGWWPASGLLAVWGGRWGAGHGQSPQARLRRWPMTAPGHCHRLPSCTAEQVACAQSLRSPLSRPSRRVCFPSRPLRSARHPSPAPRPRRCRQVCWEVPVPVIVGLGLLSWNLLRLAYGIRLWRSSAGPGLLGERAARRRVGRWWLTGHGGGAAGTACS